MKRYTEPLRTEVNAPEPAKMVVKMVVKTRVTIRSMHLATPPAASRSPLPRTGAAHTGPNRPAGSGCRFAVFKSPLGHHFLDRWVPAADRVLLELRYVERAYPVCWWRADYGVNRTAARNLRLI